MIWMLEVGLLLFAILMAALLDLDREEEWHHGYYGVALLILSAALHSPWIAVVGLILLLDDTVQHVVEAVGIVPRMADFTPIHKLGAYLMGMDWKKQGMWLPLAIGGLMAAAAVFCALHFGV